MTSLRVLFGASLLLLNFAACGGKTTSKSDAGGAIDAASTDSGGNQDAGGDHDAGEIPQPECPPLFPNRGDNCILIDQICPGNCGSVFRCTDEGWDYDFTIDGGPPCP